MSRGRSGNQAHGGRQLGVQGEPRVAAPGRGDGEVIVSLLASGLIQAHQRVAYGAPLLLPYPPALQRGLDRLSLLAIRRGVCPPAGVPELLRWCHEPIGSWPVAPVGEALAGEVLMDLGIPTRACQEWAVDAADVEGEIFEN